MTSENEKCPNFKTKDEAGSEVSLASLEGKNFVLYFYPKDDTPGCTIEANDFNRLKADFEKQNCLVFGVSRDSTKSHLKFKEKYCLNFPLLMDEEGEICTKFDVLKEKSMFGKKYIGISRDTFLVDAKGNIAKVWRNVSANGHAEEVLQTLKSLKI
jgi:peroxiredoxin Q/BCP